ncbi:hypothetical protein F4808DRAFT_273433 [Astrocystis sublimbata]|nr:hypothetical protein F4808DRAFT_273433 [Astrocystis sublimbata]
MPFPYRYICDLLHQLDNEVRKPPNKQKTFDTIFLSWFQHHRTQIHALGNDACIILSMLLPERRTDRVYNIQAQRLQSIFGKALLLGSSRVQALRRWTESGSGVDLGNCIEAILRQTPNSRDDTTHLTVEEIDEVLGRIAATCRFSSPAVRAIHRDSGTCDPNELLAGVYTQLSSRDAKWFTRLVLKNYQPVVLKPYTVFRNYHPLLPQMMKIRDDLSVAIAYVRHIDEKVQSPSKIARHLKPRIGTKVGRLPWFKGRSMKNCMDMSRGRDVICEQKMDGEYCQIHIDLSKPSACIQIFSKSGKDSTADRAGLHRAIRESLKIGDPDCPIVKGCILEGELVVYSTEEHGILPFHKIRKHVSRSGSFIGAAIDSQAHDYEHLMIVYYDVLLIDDESLLGVKNSERFQRLSKLVTCREGHAELVTRTRVRTSQSSAVPVLRELFAQCITSRGEGLVLKPDEPYFDFTTTFRRFGCCNIKLKKEYIQGWGDVGDFAVVGASYDAAKAREYKLRNVKWTHFFIGCLENKNQAREKTEMPRFRVTNVVELTGPILSAFWAQRSPITVPYEENTFIELDYTGRYMAKKPTAVFPDPLVFDVRCFNFDREHNTTFWSMRFPQVSKVHHDRSYLDTITLAELQEIAEAVMNTPDEEDGEEMRKWIKALEQMDRGRFPVDEPSQATSCSDPPPSPSPSSIASSQSTSRQPRRTLPTPPRSSATIPPVTLGDTEKTSPRRRAMNHDKRRINERLSQNNTAKRHRTQYSQISVNSSQQSTPTASSFGHTQHREPLSQVEANGSKKPPTPVDPHSANYSKPTTFDQGDIDVPAEKPAVSSPAAYYTASEMVSSSPAPDTPVLRSSVTVTTDSQSRGNASNSSCCSINNRECPLVNCFILLAPCISSYALVTEDLLKRHGIVDPILDPRVWINKDAYTSTTSSFECTFTPSSTSASPSMSTFLSASGSGSRRRRIRNICLVETRRKEATKAFLQKLKDTDLRKKDGTRERVTIYDWRVLESIMEFEEAFKDRPKTARETDPWRRWYVGIV